MSDIDTSLRSLARVGRLNHASVAFSGGKWVATYRGVDHNDARHASSDDPTAALLMAITGRKVESTMKPVAQRTTRKPAPKPTPAPPALDDEDDLL